MRKILYSVSALALSATVAHAGGMVVPQEPIVTQPTPAPMLRHAYDWTGGYAGLGLTYGRASYRSDIDDDLGDALDLDGNAFWPSGSGLGLGGFAGFNWQSGNMVYGVEGHLSGHRMRGSTDLGLGDDVDVRTSVRSMASLRGRVGIAQDQTLFFLTAGPAMASVRHNATFGEGEDALEISDRRTVNGWVVGAGIEHAMGNGWNLRGDVEHHRFRGRDFNTGADDLGVEGSTFPNVRTRVNLVRVSAVFRF